MGIQHPEKTRLPAATTDDIAGGRTTCTTATATVTNTGLVHLLLGVSAATAFATELRKLNVECGARQGIRGNRQHTHTTRVLPQVLHDVVLVHPLLSSGRCTPLSPLILGQD